MAERKTCLTSEDAVTSDVQHTKPCSDCPWARAALPGWLGEYTAEEWITIAHTETKVGCHTKIGPQCAGLAVYRANVLKLPRHKQILVLPADKQTVFSNPAEFLAHHKSKTG